MGALVRAVVFITATCWASVVMADGTGGAILKAYFYMLIVMPLLLFIPAIVIALTKQKGVSAKGEWVAASVVIGGCLFVFTYWGFENWISYFRQIPLLQIILMQSAPAYLILPIYFYFNRKRD